VLDINDDAVTIKHIELAIVNRGFEEGWIVPDPPEERTGHSVAVVGSGPAGMAAAAELNKAGHRVTVFERDEALGGLNRFGVPDFKLEKWVIDRRIRLMEEEGVEFRCGVEVGRDVDTAALRATYDAVVIAIGARVERALDVPGSDLDGVHPAMDYLYGRNRWVAAQQDGTEPAASDAGRITAEGKHVIVIGGGDTGMDCIANANRERPESVTEFDTYSPLPEGGRYPESPWPMAPRRTPSTYALDEGGERRWNSSVLELIGENGRVTHAKVAEVRDKRTPVPGTETTVPADLVLVAIGFTGVEREGLLADLGVELDESGNARANEDYETSVEGVFACGDARRGASLTVWAIAEGRRCARAIDHRLMGRDSELERSAVDESARTVGFEGLPPGDAFTPVG
jgi:glutamate synthase (NADPH/NADH) small chain